VETGVWREGEEKSQEKRTVSPPALHPDASQWMAAGKMCEVFIACPTVVKTFLLYKQGEISRAEELTKVV